MKKLILIAMALITVQGFAQQRGDGPNKENMRMSQNLTPEEAATLRTKKMTLQLDLTKSQQDEVYKINLENATRRQAMMKARKAQRANGNMEKPSKEERLQMENARLDHQIAVKAKMKKILNEEQYEKWEKSQMMRANKAKDKNKGMKKQMKKKME